MNERRPLQVAIIGAGIAGLAAASVLRKAHHVTIYEKNPEGLVEPSNAFGLGPNGSRMAQLLGLKAEDVQACTIRGYRTWDGHGNLMRNQTIDYQHLSGCQSWTVHRQDLKDGLLAAISSPLRGKPVNILYDKHVVDVDPLAGEVSFADGTGTSADLIIGADGVRSAVRAFVAGSDQAAPVPANLSFYRFSLPTAYVHSLFPGNLPVPLDFSDGPYLAALAAPDSSSRKVVIFPCRDGEMINFSLTVPDHILKQSPSQSWFATGSSNDLLHHFRDFPAWLQFIITKVKDDCLYLYQVRDLEPLECYIRGRTILIGDAAHPMIPHQGQGPSQALEDAEGLSVLLHPKVDSSNINEHLLKWEAIRRPRASEIQVNSRVASARVEPAIFLERLRFIWDYHGIKDALDKMTTHLAQTYLNHR